VLLNSNVAFLAIQSVDAQGVPKRQSDSQRASYFSVITSLGSIIFGLLMLRLFRDHWLTATVSLRTYLRREPN
jgi:hypothetical protein